MFDAWVRGYERLTLTMPWLVGLIVLALLAVAVHQSRHFKLDASADSLVLEGDDDLAYYREVRARYGSDDFLIVTYTPRGELFAEETLAHLARLRDELAALERVSSVMSILDVPLIDSPRVTLNEIMQGVRTLSDPTTDPALAKREFQTSPLYRNLVMNPEGTTTAMMVNLHQDPEAAALLEQREALRSKRDSEGLDAAERETLARVTEAYSARNAELQAALQQDIADVRAILERHRDEATIFLGGVPMIASDMVEFVRSDIRTFGIGVGLFIILLLAISFRRLRWVLVPALICAAVAVVMTGFLGLMDWRVTIVSSNFISLVLIITLSLCIHLVVRHRELHALEPQAPQGRLLRETLRSKFVPSVFTMLTTMVSFAALIVSDIRPVMDFGLMMTVGMVIAFLLTFLIFPAALSRRSPGAAPVERRDFTARVTGGFAGLTERYPLLTWIGFGLMIVAGFVGISRLTVENRFIDYFHESTEIYQGMLQIDRELGGTTPLDVVLDPPAWFVEELEEYAEFALPGDGGLSADSYWYNTTQLAQVAAIHDYLESLRETGKVLSMATTMAMVTQINNNEPPGNFALALMHRMLPPDLKEALFDPYMAEDGNQIRFAIRVIDSDHDLRRNAFLNKLNAELIERFDLEPEQLRLSGMLVLYNNVMQSLFRSQMMTLIVVFLAIGVMFWLLFRSLTMAVIGVVPTMVAAGLILGLMGWLSIPLDIMTITIAAITIGIGVDDTIHYTHRFKDEVREGGYVGAVARSHGSVGRAMFYTTVVITLGFSILSLSNFIPTIYFGLFTGIAMIFALVTNLTLLPLLLMKLRPFAEPV